MNGNRHNESPSQQLINDYESNLNYDVFISYASPDVETAKYLCCALEENNLNCWMAPRDILPGMEFGTAIIDAIRKCRIMVLVFSFCANQSPQVRREVERAVDKQMPIITFRIQKYAPSGAMEFYLSNTQWLDALIPPLENHIQHLCTTIRAILFHIKDSVSNIKQKPQQIDQFSKLHESLEAKFRELTEKNSKITIEVAANDQEKVWQISNALSQSLSKKGFQKSDSRKCVIVLKELLDNIIAHSGDTEQLARITFLYGSEYGYPALFMQIEDRGNGFDYKSTINELLLKLESGDREHGLLRAMRYGTEMTCEVKDTCAITWTKAQRPERLKSIFDGEDIVAPIVLDYDEMLLRINMEIYHYWEYKKFPDNPYFMDFIFEPLRRSSAPYVGYEVRGYHGTVPGSLPSMRVMSSLWEYMKRRLPEKELIIFADSECEDHGALNEAVNKKLPESLLVRVSGSTTLADLPLSKHKRFFEDIRLCRKYLKKQRKKKQII